MIVRPCSPFALGTWVMEQTANRFRVSPMDLFYHGGTREAEIVRVRWAVTWVMRQLTDSKGRKKLTMRDVGRLLGYADHTTAGYGLRQAEWLRDRDPDFRAKTDGLLDLARSVWGTEE